MSEKTTIVIADDHPILLKGLSDFLNDLGLKILDTASNGIHLLEKIKIHRPDIVLMDMEMPGMTGLEVAEQMNRQGLESKKILLTLHKELFLLQKAKELQFSGYILKEFALTELSSALEIIKKGGSYFSEKIWEGSKNPIESPVFEPLTPSEIKILRLIAEGYATREIADKLFISERTVEKHRSNMITKLDLEKKHNSLLLWAQRNREIIG
ncbi:response regulator [Algoriphagus litoralis]|uniref:response regulator n=1 Tax=Algoriphagus litoralis TaxID=2202829 RepID=UPI000DB8F9A6|nr:response regulator transcription factor [Algoriphagus litoralis]